MNAYKAQLIRTINDWIEANERKAGIADQMNVMATRETLEVIEGLNEMKACKVAREIAAVEARSGSKVFPSDFAGFANRI